MPQNMPLPTNAKMTALVCSGRILPKVVNGVSRFSCGQNNWQAINRPAAVPTRPQMAVAIANARTMWLSYLNVSIVSGGRRRPVGLALSSGGESKLMLVQLFGVFKIRLG